MLSQEGRPVAFFSKTLTTSEKTQSSVEKEAKACVEAVKKWYHYLSGRRFTLITDQRSVAFILDPLRKGKTRNAKIARWRLELLGLDFDVHYRPGSENLAANTLSRDCIWALKSKEIKRVIEAHDSLCHPGVERLWPYIQERKWPVTLGEVRKVVNSSSICSHVKPCFVKYDCGSVIKSSRPWERLVMDFKGPVPSSRNGNIYILIVVDEYSRYPFAFPCRDQSTETVISCLNQLFTLFGLPDSIHSDRGSSFTSERIRSFLGNKGIHTSHSCPRHPTGNGQCERYVGLVWKGIELALNSRKLPWEAWEAVLPDSLHSIRSLINTVTRQTPHERFLGFTRKTTSGAAVPKWLLDAEGKSVWLRNFYRTSKLEPRVQPVKLLEVFPSHARVEFENGRQGTVSIQDIARRGEDVLRSNEETETDGSTVDLGDEVPEPPGGSLDESAPILVDNIRDNESIEDRNSSNISLESSQEEEPSVESSHSECNELINDCLLYTSPSPRDKRQSRMPSSA